MGRETGGGARVERPDPRGRCIVTVNMARIRCAGGGRQPRNRPPRIPSAPACGWEGERTGRPTIINGEVHWNVITIPDDPCPECGGRVEWTPEVD